jgi:hypothetical protein
MPRGMEETQVRLGEPQKLTDDMVRVGAIILQEALYEDLRLDLSAAESLAGKILSAGLGISQDFGDKRHQPMG